MPLIPEIIFDRNTSIRFLARKEQLRQARLDDRFRRASDDFSAIVSMTIRDYAPLRIWQWGSLLDRSRFSEISDIDIAVEGILGEERFFALWGAADRMTDFSLDLVQLEKIHPLHAQTIRERGRLVYER